MSVLPSLDQIVVQIICGCKFPFSVATLLNAGMASNAMLYAYDNKKSTAFIWFVEHVISYLIYCYCYICREVGSQWALETAKHNLVNNYLVVGLTEELGEFVAVLEAALPRFFTGATELYNSGGFMHV